MKHIVKYLILALAVMSAASCKSEFDLLMLSNDPDVKYAGAMSYFEQKRYQKAAQLFESLSVLTSGSSRDDTVQYYWGLSNYKFKDYYTAETNFSNFINRFPASPFTSEATFLRLDCLFRGTYRYELDQTPTYKALTAINEYLIEYPATDRREVCEKMIEDLNERLERKAYENAYIYYKMEDYKAARVALKNVLKENSENRYREQILYYTAMASYKYAQMSVSTKQTERYLVFADDYLNFIGEYPESKYRKELDAIYKRVKEKN